MSDDLKETGEANTGGTATTPESGGASANQPLESPPTPPPGPPADLPEGGVHVHTGEMHSGTANFGQVINDIKAAYFNDGHGFSNIVVRSFAFNEMWRINEGQQKELAGLFVADAAEVERLRSLLVEKRVLVLSGEAGIGKTTTAIYLSSLVSARRGAGDTSESANAGDGEAKSQEAYLIPSLDRYVRVDLTEICRFKKDVPSNRFLIFENAVSRRNPDLLGFFTQLNQVSLGGFADNLKNSNSYLVFTITTSDATQLQPHLADNALQYELKHLSDELLSKGLEQKLACLARDSKVDAERLKPLQEPQQQRSLIARLKTMPRIVRFVEYYLQDLDASDVGVDVGETIRRFEDTTYRFQQELADDFDAWCFTLSLGLAHCLGESQGVSWVAFEHLRRAVSQCLRRDPELFPHKFRFNDRPSIELAEKAPAVVDDIDLKKSHAAILKAPNGLADLIRFNEEAYPEKLWEILLKHHRRILLILLPRLRAIAEDYSADHDPAQRALCAQIIGRIGEIDPDRITLSLMNRWLYSDDVRHRAAIGALYQGILASKDERYRLYFLELLKYLTAFDETGGGDANEKNRLLTAIAVYARVGAYDLSLAMKALEKIVRGKFAPVMDDVQRIGLLIERTQNKFDERLSDEEAVHLLLYQEMFRDLAGRIFAQQRSTFVGVLYALCSLSLSTDPISVFRELRQWVETSNQATGALVALMFLIKDGIAATLESRQVEISNTESTSAELKTCNPMIAALTLGHEAVLEMARFLVTIFESFSATFIFPREFMRYLRESFLAHLKAWVEEALPIESCRKQMENLLAELMRIHKGILFEPIYQLLHDPEFSKKDPDLKKAFVDALLWQRR